MGPICWGRCHGLTPYKCAAGSASSKDACQRTVYFQLAATFQISLNLAILLLALLLYLSLVEQRPAVFAADEAAISGMAAAEGCLVVGGGAAAVSGGAAASYGAVVAGGAASSAGSLAGKVDSTGGRLFVKGMIKTGLEVGALAGNLITNCSCEGRVRTAYCKYF
jgi:hypothetical protein